MTQFVVSLSDGRVFGVVLDVSPMTDAQVSRHRSAFGARSLDDVLAWARFLAGARLGWTVAELAGRGRSFSRAGRSRRRYPAWSACRVVESYDVD